MSKPQPFLFDLNESLIKFICWKIFTLDKIHGKVCELPKKLYQCIRENTVASLEPTFRSFEPELVCPSGRIQTGRNF